MDVAAVRAALWLPEDIHQPPDMAVPLVVSDDMLAEWEREDASGSADAAYALGVRLMQGGDLERAQEHFTRAAQRGSAAGAYARFRVAEALGSTPEEILDLLRAADEAGSAGAAYNVGEEHLRHGDADAVAAALVRAIDRARAGDAAGSADAALVLATLVSDPAQQRAAYDRADSRGSGYAAAQVGAAAEQRGDLDEAMRAYLRAARRGELQAGLRLGEVLQAAGHRRDARLIWTQTRQAALMARDTDLVAEAQRRLKPPLRTLIRSHPRIALAVTGVSAAMAVVLVASGNGRWALAALTAAMFALIYRFGTVSNPAPDDGEQEIPTVTVGGLMLSAGVQPGDGKDHDIRAATAAGWGRVVTIVVFAAYASVVALLCLWAAHQLAGVDLIRGISGAVAVIMATFALSTLKDLRNLKDPASVQDPDTLRVGVEAGFWKLRTGWHASVQGPAVREYIAAHQRVTPMWVRRGSVLFSVASGLTAAALSTLPAIAPHLVTSATAVGHLTVFLATFWLVGGSVVKVVSLSALRPPAWGITVAIYALLAIVFAIVATIFGMWNLPDLDA
jgi:tetratricopeptide (TPR) repeat protein